MFRIPFIVSALWGAVGIAVLFPLYHTDALTIGTSTGRATTTLFLSICGDSIVDDGEDCDVPGETGTYSTSIAGRQCSAVCQFGPYCGDAILQTVHGEECDDGNNTSGDFCSATCDVEPSGSGGGGSSGSGGGSSGGGSEELGDTRVSVSGKAYPNSTVNIIRDGSVIGTVRADSQANFLFNTGATPGATSFGFWSTDDRGLRSITFNTTFDVIQGAVTTVTGILIPPTIAADPTTVQRGGTVTLRGKSAPSVDIKSHINASPELVLETRTDERGNWTIPYNTTPLPEKAYTAKARFSYQSGLARRESTFGQTIPFFVGVSEGAAVSSSDLNRDSRVNLIDFSILIFWWGTNGGNSNPPADINSNNRVGLEDFSILLFNWTG